ncbi:MAG: crotonase/enoyl-CoA hydratase family protein [Saprospiraceae bacterium]|nr:crotonase/enoyl-CoA hydratase family protein [Saprospiraceae bacterium]
MLDNIATLDTLKIEIKEGILYMGLNRPEKRNAFNDTLIKSIEKVFDNLPQDVKCIIIYGIGKHFSAGLDLSELTQLDVVEGLYHSRMWHTVMDKIQFGKVPVIAALHGATVGGGLEVATACHLRVADSSAFFALPEGQRGIFVGGGASVRLPKLIGMARMADMMLTGRVFTAEEGEQIGLVNYMVDADKALEKCEELAKKIISNAEITNYAVMHILPRITDSNQSEGLLMESLIAAITSSSPEAKQRLNDFLEGRGKKVGE